MRVLSLLLLAGVASAQQIPLPAFQSTFTSPTATRGFYFQAPVAFTITGLRVPDETNAGVQCVEIRRMTAAPPAFSATANDPQVFFASNVPSNQIIPCAVSFQAGEWVGVMGACGTTTMFNWYGAGAFASSVLGQPITLMRMLTQTNLHTTGGNQPYSAEGTAQISRVEVYVNGSGGYSSSLNYGTGCYRRPGAVYENFATSAAFDLSNSSMSMIYNGSSGYIVLPGMTTFVTPSAAAVNVAHADDTEQTVTIGSPLSVPGGSTTALTVCSNGYVSTASGNGTGFTPAVAGFLAFPQTCWANWHDFNPLTGGAIKFEEVGSITYVTWLAVADFSGGGFSTFQYQFDRSNGMVHVVWQAMSAQGGNGYLTGFKASGAALDPGNRDISATLPATFLCGADTQPLALNAATRPIIGTNVNLVSTNCGAATLGVTILSLTRHDPGLDLTAIGMPGCSQYVGLDVALLFLPQGGTGSNTFIIPNNQAFAGTHVFSQSAAFVSGPNPLGVLSSNGVDLLVNLN